MPFCTLQDVFDTARSTLSDNGVSGGDFATNAVLLPWAQRAARDLFRTMKNIAHPKVGREIYHMLPANTAVLVPATAGITDMQEPETLDERGDLIVRSITGAVNVATGLSVTAVSHGFITGDLITLNAIGGLKGTEGLYGITITSGDVFVANGCVSTGTYSSGGVAVKSNDGFRLMDNVNRIASAAPNGVQLNTWVWRDGIFWFPTVPTDRQLRIRYSSSATAPVSTSDVIGVDDGLDFLATWTAALYAQSQRAQDIFADLAYNACGDTRSPSGATGGLLRDLLCSAVKREQVKPTWERSRPTFRDPRSYIDGVPVG